MEIKEYQVLAGRTRPFLDSMDNIHMLLGMTTEVGELIDTYKKNLAYGKSVDIVNVQEEVGDILWYIVNFCTINNLDISKIMEVNIDKLSYRYPEKFTKELAIKRNLEKEREILETIGFRES
jgi:NTP pyrophosphatase (non-canonical NTP hydrolase)